MLFEYIEVYIQMCKLRVEISNMIAYIKSGSFLSLYDLFKKCIQELIPIKLDLVWTNLYNYYPSHKIEIKSLEDVLYDEYGKCVRNLKTFQDFFSTNNKLVMRNYKDYNCAILEIFKLNKKYKDIIGCLARAIWTGKLNLTRNVKLDIYQRKVIICSLACKFTYKINQDHIIEYVKVENVIIQKAINFIANNISEDYIDNKKLDNIITTFSSALSVIETIEEQIISYNNDTSDD